MVEARATRSEAADEGLRIALSSGESLDAERLLVATGRKPNVEDLGLEQLGVRISEKGIAVDDRMNAADGVWAIGDPTGVALLTHVGKYQARVAASNIAGRDYRADYRADNRADYRADNNQDNRADYRNLRTLCEVLARTT